MKPIKYLGSVLPLSKRLIVMCLLSPQSTLMLTTSQTKQVNEERTMKAMLQADSNASRPPNLNGLYLSIPNHEVSYVIVAALKCLRIDRAQLIL